MQSRQCSRSACTRPVAATLSYDYAERLAVLGPLGLERRPHLHDLCAPCAEELTVPRGWTLLRPTLMESA